MRDIRREEEEEEELFGEPDLPPLLLFLFARANSWQPFLERVDVCTLQQVSKVYRPSALDSLFVAWENGSSSPLTLFFLSQFLCHESLLFYFSIRPELQRRKMWWRHIHTLPLEQRSKKGRWVLSNILASLVTSILTHRLAVATSWAFMTDRSLYESFLEVGKRGASMDGLLARMAELSCFHLAKEVLVTPCLERMGLKMNDSLFVEDESERGKKREGSEMAPLKSIATIFLANVLARVLVYPISTVRSDMECRKLHGRVEGVEYYRNEFDCIHSTMEAEGVAGFYRGVSTQAAIGLLGVALFSLPFLSSKLFKYFSKKKKKK